MGKVIDTLIGFKTELQGDEAALAFIGQAQLSERNARKQKAARLL